MAALCGKRLLEAAESVASGQHTLGDYARRSPELLAMTAKEKRKQVDTAVAKSYLKVLKSLAELHRTLAAWGIHVLPSRPGVPQLALALVPSQPPPDTRQKPATTRTESGRGAAGTTSADPPGPALQYLGQLDRVSWLLFRYLPRLVLCAVFVTVLLALGHGFRHPHKMGALVLRYVAAALKMIPGIVGELLDSLSGLAFDLLFGANVAAFSPSPRTHLPLQQPPAPEGITDSEAGGITILLLVALALGWIVTAPQPARPRAVGGLVFD